MRPVVVEAGQHIGRAELAVVEQVAGGLVVAVDADFETGYRENLLNHADIEHVGALRQHRIVGGDGGLLRRVLHQREIGRRSQHLRRRREVSRIAGVEGGAVVRLPGQADARAELVGIDILIHLVEPQSGVQGQVVGDLPLVLKIGADQPAGLGAGIEHREWRIDRLPVAGSTGNTVDMLLTKERSALTENPNRSVWA